MLLEHCRSALLQLHLNSRLNNWLQLIGQRQLLYEMGNIYVLEFGATYIRDLTVLFLSADENIQNDWWDLTGLPSPNTDTMPQLTFVSTTDAIWYINKHSPGKEKSQHSNTNANLAYKDSAMHYLYMKVSSTLSLTQYQHATRLSVAQSILGHFIHHCNMPHYWPFE